MKKIIIVCIITILGLGLFLLIRFRQTQATPAYLVKTMSDAKEVNERRLAALHLYDNHLAKLSWAANPDLSPVRDLAATATADPSRLVRAAACDSIRRLIDDTKITAITGMSKADMSTMNANREANRKTAATLIINKLVKDDKVKVLESAFADKPTENLRIQAGHVLYYLLILDTEQRLKKLVSEECQMNLKAWFTGAHNKPDAGDNK